MKKKEAIEIINRQIGSPLLNSRNTHFANVNSSKNVWWFDLSTSKAFSQSIPNLHLLLYQHNENKLFHLKVPTSFFLKKRSDFIIRDEKETISLELSADKATFLKDIRPGSGKVSFTEFVQ